MRPIGRFALILCASLVGLSVRAGDGAGSGVRWAESYDRARARAQVEGRPLYVLFGAEWCPACVRLERQTLTEASVARLLNDVFVAVHVDVDEHAELARQFSADRLPVAVVLAPNGTEIGRILGNKPPAEYQTQLETILQRLPRRPAPADRPVLVKLESSQTTFAGVTRSTGPTHTAPHVALGGFCATTLVDAKQLAYGSVEYSAVYDGQTYWFASTHEQRRFLLDPTRYAPVYAGLCPIALLQHGQQVAGDPHFGAIYRGRLYLFAGAEERRRFREDPARFADADLVLDGQCPVCAVESRARIEGSPQYQAIHRGQLFRFHSDEHLRMFLRAGDRYAQVALAGQDGPVRR